MAKKTIPVRKGYRGYGMIGGLLLAYTAQENYNKVFNSSQKLLPRPDIPITGGDQYPLYFRLLRSSDEANAIKKNIQDLTGEPESCFIIEPNN